MPPLLGESEIEAAMTELPDWERCDGSIQRTYEFRSFREGIAFVDRVAVLAETANHHPDIDIRWTRVTLTLATHSAGGLTVFDFKLARQCDEAWES